MRFGQNGQTRITLSRDGDIALNPATTLLLPTQYINQYSGESNSYFRTGRNANEHLEIYVNDSLAQITLKQDETTGATHTLRHSILSGATVGRNFEWYDNNTSLMRLYGITKQLTMYGGLGISRSDGQMASISIANSGNVSSRFESTATSGNYSYTRLVSGGTWWDVAVKDTEQGGAFQLRPNGGGTNALLYSSSGKLNVTSLQTAGNITIQSGSQLSLDHASSVHANLQFATTYGSEQRFISFGYYGHSFAGRNGLAMSIHGDTRVVNFSQLPTSEGNSLATQSWVQGWGLDEQSINDLLQGYEPTHSHPYLPLAGGTLSGNLTIEMASATKLYVHRTGLGSGSYIELDTDDPAQYGFSRFRSDSTFWDIGVSKNVSGGALQFRPSGGTANAMLYSSAGVFDCTCQY